MEKWQENRNYRRIKDQNGNIVANIITVDGMDVPVTEEVYAAYAKMDRRERYLSEDVPAGRLLSLEQMAEDGVYAIVDGLIVRLGCTLHIDGAVQMSRIVDAGKPAELLEQGRTLLLRDKVGGRHSVRQQFQFRQFKNTGTDKVAVLFAFHADNIVAGVQQEPDISVHILPVGTDARIFPISQDIRTGYEMGFIRLFIQQFQQQEQAALIIFLQRNSPIYSLGPDFRPQVQSYSATTSLNRMRMAAASARVAWPLGSKTPSPLPLISPSALAHWRASRA